MCPIFRETSAQTSPPHSSLQRSQKAMSSEAYSSALDPGRLVFAGRMPLELHLARHRLADLFLDTLPYNAHTTASDALWAGLPLVTCCGKAFAGRVASSLLQAVRLPELVTHSLADYEALALRLARKRSLLRGFRERLAQNRLTHPLFDTDRFRRDIEAAYTTMWEIAQRGDPPRSFTVAQDQPLAIPRPERRRSATPDLIGGSRTCRTATS
jgi:protein O-GlcNAc transferase